MNTSLVELPAFHNHKVVLPTSTSARQEIYKDFVNRNELLTIPLETSSPDGESIQSSHVYSIPEKLCYQLHRTLRLGHAELEAVVNIKFICICLTPALERVIGVGGLKAVENKLELILLPSTETSNNFNGSGSKR